MTIREQIDRILAARKEKGKELEARLEAWKKLKESLYRGTSSLVMESMDIKDDKLREQYGRIFNDVDASEVELLKLMDQVVAAMGDGVKRFNRDYISIATVGKERQARASSCSPWATWTMRSSPHTTRPAAPAPPPSSATPQRCRRAACAPL